MSTVGHENYSSSSFLLLSQHRVATASTFSTLCHSNGVMSSLDIVVKVTWSLA